VRFRIGPHGKPALEHPGSVLEFSASDARDVAVIAFASGVAIGVDVEHVSAYVDAAGIIAKNASGTEREMFARLPPERLVPEFYRWWTAREARLKASGVGLRGAAEPKDASWIVRNLNVGVSYSAALATEEKLRRVRTRKLHPRDPLLTPALM
jgi:phosphopantetheinyl transferase